MSEYRLEHRPATEEERAIILAGLRTHALEVANAPPNATPFGILAQDGETFVGGAVGQSFWNWLYLDLLWIEKSCRGKGLGRRLVEATEAEARLKGLTGIYLWTQSWQAPSFYAKLGYELFAKFPDFPPGAARFGYRKYL